MTELPRSLQDNPRPARWLGFAMPGRVRLGTGKVELGQGILTALVQIAAEELELSPACFDTLSGDTDAAPEEGFTAGSQSVEASGSAVRVVAAEVRARFLAAAALRLNCAPASLRVADGVIVQDGAPTALTYWTLAPSVDLDGPLTAMPMLRAPADFRWIGRSLPRVDLPAKVTGAQFLHDIAPADMLHARVLHRPRPDAQLGPLDATAIARAAGGPVDVLRIGDFAAVLADTEAVAERAHEAAERLARWKGGTTLADAPSEALALVGLSSTDRDFTVRGKPSAQPATATFSARYTRPYLAHASIAPSVATARWDGAHLEVLTHSQGVGMLRTALAAGLGLDVEAISVRHRQGAGCYGHNGADDAAMDAALIARERPDRTVRVQWSRAQELSVVPFGSAMAVGLAAALDADGRPVDWTIEVWSGTHGQRPGHNGRINLLAASALPGAVPTPPAPDVPDAAGFGGLRNAIALYDLPPQRIVHHLIERPKLRTSSMRGLGAHANVFAIESFVDELALRAGEDPLAYRLSLLSDPRARRVLEAAAAMAGWRNRPRGGDGAGWGVAFSRYKNRAAYMAAVVALTIEQAIVLDRVWCAVDAGLVINPDGAANQIEGGVIQAASWTLKEAVRVEDGAIATIDWERYPIMRFSEVPEVSVAFVGDSDDPPLGLGEAALGPTAAAIGNAAANALGVRVRDMPLTREHTTAALLEGAER
jgi:nicotinate dehydrogenase subunit B